MNKNKLIILIACIISFYNLTDWIGMAESSSNKGGNIAEYQPRRIPRSIKFKRMGYRYATLIQNQDQGLA